MKREACPLCGKESESFVLSFYRHCLDCEGNERRGHEDPSQRLATDRHWKALEFYRKIRGAAL
ncbi:MAG: hypothetical protein A2Z34_00710 [Planctomycetes bacterium RBG_16_59_8]|nr:MAG: hypothetical protein A2Z34_00710 [Planctomycetes bacterium RBG_16_59_8]